MHDTADEAARREPCLWSWCAALRAIGLGPVAGFMMDGGG